MSGFGRGGSYRDVWAECLSAYGNCNTNGCQALAASGAAQPQLRGGSADIELLPDGRLDLSELQGRKWGLLPNDYAQVRDQPVGHCLPAFRARLSIVDVLRFVDIRLRAGAPLPETHWLSRLRGMLVQTCAFLLEAFIESERARTVGQFTARPTELWGAGGLRRSPHQPPRAL